jgi:hypothetical protein
MRMTATTEFNFVDCQVLPEGIAYQEKIDQDRGV